MKILISLLCVIIVLAIGVFYLTIGGQAEASQTPQKLEEKTKVSGVSPELREKAFVLLEEVVKETENLKLSQNRIQLKIQAADLLWEKDETKARIIFDGTLAELQNSPEDMLNGLVYDNRLGVLNGLKYDLVETLIERDVRKAEEVFNKFKNVEDYRAEKITNKIFEKYLYIDPNKSYKIAQEIIIQNGISSYYEQEDKFYFLTDLHKADPKLGSKLAGEVLDFIETKTISINPKDIAIDSKSDDAKDGERKPRMKNIDKMKDRSRTDVSGNFVEPTFDDSNSNMYFGNSNLNTLPNSNKEIETNELSFFQIGSFLKTVNTINSEAGKQNPPQPLILSENNLQKLATKLVNSLIEKKDFNYYDVALIYPELVKYAPAQVQKLRRQMKPAEIKEFDKEILRAKDNGFSRFSIMDKMSDWRSINDILEDIEKASPEKLDDLYAEAVRDFRNYSCCTEAEFACGFEYYLKIKNKNKFPDLVEEYGETFKLYNAINGDLKEMRNILAKEKDKSKRLKLLSQAANSLVQKGELESAEKLMLEAKELLPVKIKNSSQMKAYIAYLNTLTFIDANQSFSLFESFVEQSNQIINNNADYYLFWDETVDIKNDEFLFYNMELQSAKHIYPSIPILKKLAQTDFERTVNLANKFSRPEVRLFARWYIAQSLLNNEAEKQEKDFADDAGVCG